MCESREVQSGQVYHQLFEAQVQLSRCLLTGRRQTTTDNRITDDSKNSSGEKRLKTDEDVDDVFKLPDTVVVDCPRSDIIERLAEKKSQDHAEAVDQMEGELTETMMEFESQVRTITLETTSSDQEADLRLNSLMERMEHVDHNSLQEPVSLQEHASLQEPVGPASLQKPVEPASLQEVVEPASLQEVVEPVSLQEPVEPASLQEPVEPVSLQEPVEPASLQEPVEPASLQEVVEPVSLQEPVEPVSLQEPVEPASLQEVVEPVSLQEPVEPVSLQEPVEPVSLQEPVEPVSLQEVYTLWEEVEEEVKLKKISMEELNFNLTECETERTEKLRVVLRKFYHLLQKISFLSPADISILIHNKASLLNLSILVNRRSVALLMLRLQEGYLHRESLLRLCWENCLRRWKRSRVHEIIDNFRCFCGSDGDPLISGHVTLQDMKQTQSDLTEQRCDIITKIRFLVPPSCSTAEVSDWFNQLTAVNQLTDQFHDEVINLQRRRYEQRWQQRLDEMDKCKEALSALQLSEEEVNRVVTSKLLTLIGRSRTEDEERLAALDKFRGAVACHALGFSSSVFVVMRGAALLWETHRLHLGRREEEIQEQLEELRASQQQQLKKKNLNELLASLRQASGEDALKTSLDRTLALLDVMILRYVMILSSSRRVSDQCQLLDGLPSLCLDELLAYSRRLCSFYLLDHAYMPNPEELQNFCPSCDLSDPAGTAEERTGNDPISCQNHTGPALVSQDWLMEAASALLDLCDISSDVIFTSSGGVAYRGPVFICPSFDLPDDVQQEIYLNLFPVQLLADILSSSRSLFLDHLEHHVHDVIRTTVAMVTERKETVRLEEELQLKHLNPKNVQTHVYLPRQAELRCHRQRVDVHCEEVSDQLTTCREELQDLQTSINRKNQDFIVVLSNMERDILTAASSRRLEAVSTTLEERLHQHIKHTQRCDTTFRHRVQVRLEVVRTRTRLLLNSFRLFSEGGDFATQEVKLFQRRLKEETKQISLTEKNIYADLETFESKSLEQVKEVSCRLEEKLSLLMSEMKFTEKIQKIISSTQVHIKAEAACSNQQHSSIRTMLQDLRTTMKDLPVCPDQVFAVLSSLNEELGKRSKYLDISLRNLSAHPTSQKQVRSATPPVAQQPSRAGADLLDDPVVGLIKSLNRFCVTQEVLADAEERGKPSSGRTPDQRLHQRSADSTLRSIRTDRRFKVFGPEPEPKENTQSFSSKVTSVLRRANDALLLVAEDFYQSVRSGVSRFLLVPDTVDQWAESMQQRLLGYQDQAKTFLRTSTEELLNQLLTLDELLHSIPLVLIGNHERCQGVALREEVGGVRQKLEEAVAASEKEKQENVRRLRASLRDDRLQALINREDLRQQQLHGAICNAHQELQDSMRARGEEFVKSLASLTENLIHQMDNKVSPAETEGGTSLQHTGDGAVTKETNSAQKLSSRTWSGIQFFQLPTDTTAEPRPRATPTASISTTRCTMGHLAVIEQRDAAVKRFEELLWEESTWSHDDRQRRLQGLQSWSSHWRKEMASRRCRSVK